MKIYTVDKKTGEVEEKEIVCPFASILDLKKDAIKDGEDYEPGSSVTSLEGYEPLESIVARCMRTIQSPNGSTYQVLDTDALKAEETQQGIYEASGASNVDEAFQTLDPTESQGFDLADASALQESVARTLNSSNLPTQGVNDDNSKSKVNDEVVDKSEQSSDFPEKTTAPA